MEIYVTEQLRTFLLSVLLGFAMGGAYDILGAIRGRWRALTAPLDVVYCVSVAMGLFFFTLHQAQGQLRMFVLGGAVGGSVLFFTGFSSFLRPVWAFWVETGVCLWELVMLPLQLCKRTLQKIIAFAKNLFYFWKKYSTIKYDYKTPLHKGGTHHGEEVKEQKKQKA